MYSKTSIPTFLAAVLIISLACPSGRAAALQAASGTNGTVEGSVTFAGTGAPLPGLDVIIVETKQTALTDDAGRFSIVGVAPGAYTIEVRGEGLIPVSRRIQINLGGITQTDFKLTLSPLAENVVVSASPHVQEIFRTYQPVSTITGTQLEQNLSGSLGETLKDQPGVNVRSFGPGSARPVIRGFDGDRVLVLTDGARTGDLASQSGDHGVPVDPASLERIEVVRGPASLLYGSNAIGGVINTVTSDVGHTAPFRGVTGHARVEGGTVNKEGAINGHVDVGTGAWVFHAGGGGRRASDYDTPQGEIPNSGARSADVKIGFDYVSPRGYFGTNFGYDDLVYGLPFAGVFEGEADARIQVEMRRHTLAFKGGLRELQGPFQTLRLDAGYTDYEHDEVEEAVVGTAFRNNLFQYQAFLDQRPVGRLTGTLGVWGLHRRYETEGAEALAPPTTQNSFAVFGYEELSWEKFKFQFGARLDHTRYRPLGLPERDFTGLSGSLGLMVDLRPDTVFAANYGLAYRAPALEELYNHGPHIGTLSFEIGNPNLQRELGHGIDLALRHNGKRARAEFNFFYVDIGDFIFGSPTGEIEDNLPVFDFLQSDSRFTGFEAAIDVGLTDWLRLNLGSDFVRAELSDSKQALPRIPPLRGRAGLEFRFKGLTVSPQIVAASEQDRIFGPEKRTPGHALFNVRAAYVWTSGTIVHTVTAGLLNASDVLYRNHLSFIKEFAPEAGRNLKVSYTVNF